MLILFLDLANLCSFKLTILLFSQVPVDLWALPYFLKIKMCFRLILYFLFCPQPGISHLFKELWFFYLIDRLMCIQSPIPAFTFSLVRVLYSPCLGSNPPFLDTHILSCMGSLLTLLGWWDCLNSDPSSHAVPSTVTGSSFYLDSDTLLWTVDTSFFSTIDSTLLYPLNSFGIKMLRIGKHLYYTFNWSIKILWAFQEKKMLCWHSIRKKKTDSLFKELFRVTGETRQLILSLE